MDSAAEKAFLEGLQAYLDENPGCTAVEVADWVHAYLDKCEAL